jgi:hypothetical protein
LQRLTAAPTVFIIFSRAVACHAVRQPRGAVAMMKNLVPGLVLAALVVMGLLAFAQKHEGCLHGRSLHTFKPCGSMSSSM